MDDVWERQLKELVSSEYTMTKWFEKKGKKYPFHSIEQLIFPETLEPNGNEANDRREKAFSVSNATEFHTKTGTKLQLVHGL